MKTKFLIFSLSLFLVSKISYAIDFTIGLDAPPVQLSGVVNNDSLVMVASDSSSYCCGMINYSSTANGRFSSLTNFSAISPAAVARGGQYPLISGGGSNASNRRYCWYEANSSTGTLGARGFVFGNITGSISPYVSCEETTLYGNYNTSVSEFNFLELTARSSFVAGETLSGVITLISATNGERRTQNFSFSFETLASNNVRTDISIHDLLQNHADFGAIVIKHNGAPGQLSAKISYYDVTSTSPLNFTLVGQSDFHRGTSSR